MTTLAGGVGQPGHANGTGPAARFGLIHGIAVGPDQHLYIADTSTHLIRKMTPSGQVSTLAGLPGAPGVTNGAGSTARFSEPADEAVIRRVVPSGFVSTLSGSGYDFGPGHEVGFTTAHGIAVNGAGELIVSNGRSGYLAIGTPLGERIQRSSGAVNLFFGVEPFRAYHLERSTALGSNQWTRLASPSANFSGAIKYTDAAAPLLRAYYRLRPQ